jgi:hypothetical protein
VSAFVGTPFLKSVKVAVGHNMQPVLAGSDRSGQHSTRLQACSSSQSIDMHIFSIPLLQAIDFDLIDSHTKVNDPNREFCQAQLAGTSLVFPFD